MNSSTKEATKRAAIYRRAALLMETKPLHTPDQSGHQPRVKFSCCAVAEAEGIFAAWNNGDQESQLANDYRCIFDGDFEYDDDARVIALCFMAALVEAGDA